MAVLLLAVRAQSECARPMRESKATLAAPLNNMWRGKKKTGLAIPYARSTRGRGLPSLDARTTE
ncbi:MAG: hypothetical protein Q8S75_04070 [Nitrospirota bacterium]|nr:hypothetical protein [Nitrospirota bacterium]